MGQGSAGFGEFDEDELYPEAQRDMRARAGSAPEPQQPAIGSPKPQPLSVPAFDEALNRSANPNETRNDWEARQRDLGGAGLLGPIRPRYRDSALEEQATARDQQEVSQRQHEIARENEVAARENERQQAAADREAERQQREAAQAAEKARRGQVNLWRDQGVALRRTADGLSFEPERHADGGVKFTPSTGDPYQDAEGKWVRDLRDDRGQTRQQDLLGEKQFTTDRETGEQYIRHKGEKIVIGQDDRIVKQNELRARQDDLREQNALDGLTLTEKEQAAKELKAKLDEQKKSLKPMEKAWQSAKLTVGPASPTFDSGAFKRAADDYKAALGPMKETEAALQAHQAEIDEMRKSRAERQREIIGITSDVKKLQSARRGVDPTRLGGVEIPDVAKIAAEAQAKREAAQQAIGENATKVQLGVMTPEAFEEKRAALTEEAKAAESAAREKVAQWNAVTQRAEKTGAEVSRLERAAASDPAKAEALREAIVQHNTDLTRGAEVLAGKSVEPDEKGDVPEATVLAAVAGRAAATGDTQTGAWQKLTAELSKTGAKTIGGRPISEVLSEAKQEDARTNASRWGDVIGEPIAPELLDSPRVVSVLSPNGTKREVTLPGQSALPEAEAQPFAGATLSLDDPQLREKVSGLGVDVSLLPQRLTVNELGAEILRSKEGRAAVQKQMAGDAAEVARMREELGGLGKREDLYQLAAVRAVDPALGSEFLRARRGELTGTKMEQQAGREAALDEVKRGAGEEFATSVGRGLLGTVQSGLKLAAEASPVKGTPLNALNDAALTGLDSLLEAGMNSPELKRSTDIKTFLEGGWRDARAWTAGVGENLPNLLPSIGVMAYANKIGAGGQIVQKARALVAAAEAGETVAPRLLTKAEKVLTGFNRKIGFGTEFSLEYGGLLQDASRDPETGGARKMSDGDKLLALGGAALAGAVGAFGDEKLFSLLGRAFKGAPDAVKAQAAKELAKQAPTLARRMIGVAKEAGEGLLIENAQELLQTTIEDATAKVGWNPKMTADDFKEDLAQTVMSMSIIGAGGPIVSHAAGAATRGLDRVASRGEARRFNRDARTAYGALLEARQTLQDAVKSPEALQALNERLASAGKAPMTMVAAHDALAEVDNHVQGVASKLVLPGAGAELTTTAQRMVRELDPEDDGAALVREIQENPVLGRAALSIGAQMREDAAPAQRVERMDRMAEAVQNGSGAARMPGWVTTDTLIGAHLLQKHLPAVAMGDATVPGPILDGLHRAGLVVMGNDGQAALSPDAVALLPKTLRAEVAKNPAGFNLFVPGVATPEGPAPGAVVNHLAEHGEEIVAEAAKASAESDNYEKAAQEAFDSQKGEGVGPRDFSVRVRASNKATGPKAEMTLKVRAADAADAERQVRTRFSKTGDTIDALEVQPVEQGPSREDGSSAGDAQASAPATSPDAVGAASGESSGEAPTAKAKAEAKPERGVLPEAVQAARGAIARQLKPSIPTLKGLGARIERASDSPKEARRASLNHGGRQDTKPWAFVTWNEGAGEPDFTLVYDERRLAQIATSSRLTAQDVEDYVAKTIGEEIKHLASLEVIRAEWEANGKRGTYHEAYQDYMRRIYDAMSRSQRGATRKLYGGTGLTPEALAAEHLRQMMQLAEDGRTTETFADYLIEHFRKVLAVLKRLLADKAAWSPALQKAVDDAEGLLKRVETEAANQTLSSSEGTQERGGVEPPNAVRGDQQPVGGEAKAIAPEPAPAETTPTEPTLKQALAEAGLTVRDASTGSKLHTKEILRDGEVVFTGRASEVWDWLKSQPAAPAGELPVRVGDRTKAGETVAAVSRDAAGALQLTMRGADGFEYSLSGPFAEKKAEAVQANLSKPEALTREPAKRSETERATDEQRTQTDSTSGTSGDAGDRGGPVGGSVEPVSERGAGARGGVPAGAAGVEDSQRDGAGVAGRAGDAADSRRGAEPAGEPGARAEGDRGGDDAAGAGAGAVRGAGAGERGGRGDDSAVSGGRVESQLSEDQPGGAGSSPAEFAGSRSVTKHPESPGAEEQKPATFSTEEQPKAEKPARVLDPSAENHRIEPDDVLVPGGDVAKIRGNLAAIELLRTLQRENRNATPEEKKVLAKYVGWGGLSQVFDDAKAAQVERGDIQTNRDTQARFEQMAKQNPYSADYYNVEAQAAKERADALENWQKKYGKWRDELKPLLSEEEWRSASGSTLNAHYTDRSVIDAMWKMIARLGFTGGRVLEPAGGAGHFFGLMPEGMAKGSSLFGVELDSLTGAIFQKLYPQAQIQVKGFEDAVLPFNSMDLVVSNVPFGKTGPYDKRYATKWNLHNYFFAKGLDVLKPGGLMVAISTSNTMDASARQRAELADKAELVAAFRLPNNAFKANAGTEVTTDILILRKPDGAAFRGEPWRDVKPVEIGGGKKVEVNEYFAAHPDHVLGKLTAEGSMYREGEMAVKEDPKRPLAQALQEAIAALTENIAAKAATGGDAAIRLAGDRKVGQIEVTPEGGFLISRNGQMVDALQEVPELGNPEKAKLAREFLGIRDTVRKLIDLERSSEEDTPEMAETRAALNKAYDAFAKKHGRLDSPKARFLSTDPEYYLVLGLETKKRKNVADPKSGKIKTEVTYSKADIFTKRTVSGRKAPTSAANVGDAIGVSLGYKGRIDTAYVAELTGMSEEAAKRAMIEEGHAFENPETGLLEGKDEYLSGFVRKKLLAAEAALAAGDESMQRNVEALKAVQPPRIAAKDVRAKFGGAWIPPEVVTKFGREVFEDPTFEARYNKLLDRWTVQGSETAVSRTGFGTGRINGHDLLEKALNLATAKIYDTVGSGRDAKRVLNQEETLAARIAQTKIKEQFGRWWPRDAEVSTKIEDAFNDAFNGTVPRRYNGQHLAMPTMREGAGMHPDKKDAIWRMIVDGRGMLAHGVGGGKTWLLSSIAMEWKRLGLAKKPMIVVHNSTLEQFATTMNWLFPAARIMVARKEDLAGPKRKPFMTRIATGDWDAVVIAHSSFNLIPDDADVERAFIQEKIDELKQGLVDAMGGAQAYAAAQARTTSKFNRKTGQWTEKKDPAVKDIEKQIEAFEQRLKKLADQTKDDVVTFQQLGVDGLLIDEAHLYKKTPFATKMENVAGLDKSSSGWGTGLAIKTWHIQRENKGRGVVLATGTPVTNTLGEAWNMTRLGAPDVLKAYNVDTFDKFVTAFAEVVPTRKLNAANRWVMTDRLAKFVNGPELIAMIRQAWDVKLGDDMKVERPDIEGGAPTPIIVPPSEALQKFIGFLGEVYGRWQDLKGLEKKLSSHIPMNITQVAKAASLDLRLVDPRATDDPNSKVNEALRQTFGIWKETKKNASTQLIFCDQFRPVSTSSLRKFTGGNLGGLLEDEGGEDETADEIGKGAGPAPKGKKGAKEEGFNLHDDMRAKLIKMGIPEDQVVIVNDIDDDKKRAVLFEKVNRGEVRVLIGSRAKMGTGVNVQQKLYALHQLDAPWTPSELEQSNGRGWRQGNENPKIRIHYYATEKTPDAGNFDLLATKAKTFTQLMSGNGVGREFDDPTGETIASFSQMSAMATGDPLAIKMVEVESKLSNLKAEADVFENQKAQNRDRLRWRQSELLSRRKELTQAETIAARLGELFPDKKTWRMSSGGKTETERETIVKALDRALAKAQVAAEEARTKKENNGSIEPVVTPAFEINGVRVELSTGADWVMGDDGKGVARANPARARYSLAGQAIGSGNVTSGQGLLSSLAQLPKHWADEPAQVQQSIDTLTKAIGEIEKSLAEKWERADELAAVQKEFNEIEAQMLARKDGTEKDAELFESGVTAAPLLHRLDVALTRAAGRVQKAQEGYDAAELSGIGVEKEKARIILEREEERQATLQKRRDAVERARYERALKGEGFDHVPYGFTPTKRGTLAAAVPEARPDRRIVETIRAAGKPVAIDPAWGLPEVAKGAPMAATARRGEGGHLEFLAGPVRIPQTMILNDDGEVGENPLVKYLPTDREVTREDLHRAIERLYLDRAAAAEESATGEIIYTGGGGASGKTRLLIEMEQKGEIPPPDRRVTLNSDDMKFLLPEMQAGLAARNPNAAGAVHVESNALLQRITDAVLRLERRTFIVWDATLSRPAEVIPFMQRMREMGYRQHLRGILIDPVEALVRANVRAIKTGRFIPRVALLAAHKGFNGVFPQYFAHVDTHRIVGVMFGDQVYADGGAGIRTVVVASSDGDVDAEAPAQYELADARSRLNESAESRDELERSYRGGGSRLAERGAGLPDGDQAGKRGEASADRGGDRETNGRGQADSDSGRPGLGSAIPALAREEASPLVVENLGLAQTIARSYRVPGVDAADVEQEAMRALMRAAEGFDPAKGSFAAYAGRAVRNQLNTLYRDGVRDAAREPVSLDAAANEEGESIGSLVPDATQDTVQSVRSNEAKAALKEALSKLGERPRRVIDGMVRGEDYEVIGQALGISRQAAQQLGARALEVLRKRLRQMGVLGVAEGGLAAPVPRGRVIQQSPEAEAIRQMTVPQLAEELGQRPVIASKAGLIGLVMRQRGLPFSAMTEREFLASHFFHQTNNREHPGQPIPFEKLAQGMTGGWVLGGKSRGSEATGLDGQYGSKPGQQIVAVPLTELDNLNTPRPAKIREGFKPRPQDVVTLDASDIYDTPTAAGTDRVPVADYYHAFTRGEQGGGPERAKLGAPVPADLDRAAIDRERDGILSNAMTREEVQARIKELPATDPERVKLENETMQVFTTTVADLYAMHLRGRLDKLEHFAPGTKNIVLDAERNAAFVKAAMNEMMGRIMGDIDAALGSSRDEKGQKRRKRFVAEMLPTAARLNPTGYDADGNLEFGDFNMRAGQMKTGLVEALGAKGAFITTLDNFNAKVASGAKWTLIRELTTGQWIDNAGESLYIGPVVEADGKRWHQLLRPMTAERQQTIYEEFHARYPEVAHWLDAFIAPDRADARVIDARGVTLPDFNREALRDFFGEESPFGELARVEGYTPEVFRTRTVAGMVADAYRNALNKRWQSGAREYKTGAAREAGKVRDLFQGFAIRAMEAHAEKYRKDAAEALLEKAAKPIPPDGVPAGWVPLNADTMNVLVDAMRAAQRLDRKAFPAITEALNPDDNARLKALIGEAYKLLGERKMIRQEVLGELVRPLAAQRVDSRFLMVLDSLTRSTTAAMLAHPFTWTQNLLGNEIFKSMRAAQQALYGLMMKGVELRAKARGDRLMAARAAGQSRKGLLEAGYLVRGLVADRWFVPGAKERLQSIVPRELFQGNTGIAGAVQSMTEADKTAWEHLKQANVPNAILKAARYSDMDERAKQQLAYASYMAQAEVAADESGVKFADKAARVQWMREWLKNAPDAVHRRAYASAVTYAMDYANVPWWLDDQHQVKAYGKDITPIVNIARRLLFPFAKYPYNYARQIKRLGWDSVRDLTTRREFTSTAQKMAAAANLGTYVLMLAAGPALRYALAALGGGGDDDKEIIGTSYDEMGRKLDAAFDTSSRVNVSAIPVLGPVVAGAAKMFGDDADHKDYWVRVRTIPYAPIGLLVASGVGALREIEEGKEGGAQSQAVDNWWGFVEDFASLGVGAKLIAAPFGMRQKYDEGKAFSTMLGETATDMLTSRIAPAPLLATTRDLIDPVGRRTRPAKSIGYAPSLPLGETARKVANHVPGSSAVEGFATGALSRLPGATRLLPPAGKILPRMNLENAAPKVAKLQAMGEDHAYQIHGDKVGLVNPEKLYIRPRWQTLARLVGLNVKGIERDDYKRERAGQHHPGVGE